MALENKSSGLPFIQRARQRAHQKRRDILSDYTRQYAPKIPQRLPALPKTGAVYLCPLSSVPFSGTCPVSVCPGHKPDCETGGCLYLFYGRTKLDRADIMFSHKLNDKKLQDTIAHGQEQTLRAITFYRTLNDARSSDKLGYCPECGIAHQKGIYRCDNTVLCEERKQFAQSFIERSHLQYDEIKATYRDVYLIARQMDKFKKAAGGAHTNMLELLGVGETQLKALAETMKVI